MRALVTVNFLTSTISWLCIGLQFESSSSLLWTQIFQFWVSCVIQRIYMKMLELNWQGWSQVSSNQMSSPGRIRTQDRWKTLWRYKHKKIPLHFNTDLFWRLFYCYHKVKFKMTKRNWSHNVKKFCPSKSTCSWK